MKILGDRQTDSRVKIPAIRPDFGDIFWMLGLGLASTGFLLSLDNDATTCAFHRLQVISLALEVASLL